MVDEITLTLVPVPVKVGQTQQVGTAAVERLLEGPTATQKKAGLFSGISRHARLLGFEVEDGVATVDLSSQFEIESGTTGEALVLGQLTYTLTQFPTVDSVQLKLDGEKQSFFGLHGTDVSAPMTRSDEAFYAPSDGG